MASSSQLKRKFYILETKNIRIKKKIKEHYVYYGYKKKIDFTNREMEWYHGIFGEEELPVMIRLFETTDADGRENLGHIKNFMELDSAIVDSPNILHVYGVIRGKENCLVATERVDGTLQDYIRVHKDSLFKHVREHIHESSLPRSHMTSRWKFGETLKKIIMDMINAIDAMEAKSIHLQVDIKLKDIYVIREGDDVVIKIFHHTGKECGCKEAFSNLLKEIFAIAKIEKAADADDLCLCTLDFLSCKLNWKMLREHPIFLSDLEKLMLLNDASEPCVAYHLSDPMFVLHDENIKKIAGERCDTFADFLQFMRGKIENWDELIKESKAKKYNFERHIGTEKISVIPYLEKKFPRFFARAFRANLHFQMGLYN